MVFVAGKLCDPCLIALEWFVYHTKRYTSARIYLYLYLYLRARRSVLICHHVLAATN